MCKKNQIWQFGGDSAAILLTLARQAPGRRDRPGRAWLLRCQRGPESQCRRGGGR